MSGRVYKLYRLVRNRSVTLRYLKCVRVETVASGFAISAGALKLSTR